MRDYLPKENKPRDNYQSNNNNNNNDYDPRWAHFGGRKPFSYITDKDAVFDETAKDRRLTRRSWLFI